MNTSSERSAETTLVWKGLFDRSSVDAREDISVCAHVNDEEPISNTAQNCLNALFFAKEAVFMGENLISDENALVKDYRDKVSCNNPPTGGVLLYNSVSKARNRAAAL